MQGHLQMVIDGGGGGDITICIAQWGVKMQKCW